jgi:hypothetical protein
MFAPIFRNISDVFDEWLGIAGLEKYGTKPSVPKYRSRQAAIDLSDRGGSLSDQARLNAEQVIQRAMETLVTNIPEADWRPAESNWKWEKSLKIASHNPSQEKTLEKLTVFLLDDGWVNQIPVCNGLVADGRADACRIDLGHRIAEREYELIELKFGTEGISGSDHPLFAAMEVVHYGLMYLLFRQRRFPIQRGHHLLRADRIKLIVLAPAAWYRFKRRGDCRLHSFDFGWLATQLSNGLQAYSHQHKMNLNIEMEFQALSSSFHANYLTLLGGIQAFRDDTFDTRQTLFGVENP